MVFRTNWIDGKQHKFVLHNSSSVSYINCKQNFVIFLFFSLFPLFPLWKFSISPIELVGVPFVSGVIRLNAHCILCYIAIASKFLCAHETEHYGTNTFWSISHCHFQYTKQLIHVFQHLPTIGSISKQYINIDK